MTDESSSADSYTADSDAARARERATDMPMNPGPFESNESARDDSLADLFGIDGVAEQHEAGASGLPTAASPAARPPRHRPRRSEADVSRFGARDGSDPAAAPPYVYATGAPAPGGAVGRRAQRRRAEADARKRRKAPWWELPVLVMVAIVIAVLVKTFVVQPFYIPSQSMEKTLHGCPGCKGDRILVNKPIYDLRDPHPGDIVVFDAPPRWNEEIAPQPPSNPVLRLVRGFGQLVGVVPPDGLVLVKRVIAVGGQTVKGDAAGNVFVSDNGTTGPWHQLDESSYVFKDGPDSHAAFGPTTVPRGRLWVMGDHRNDSADSRFHCDNGGADGAGCDATLATVPVDDVIGKAVVIAWPPSRWRTLGTPETFKQLATAAGGALPPAGAALIVVPVYLVRRRRRG